MSLQSRPVTKHVAPPTAAAASERAPGTLYVSASDQGCGICASTCALLAPQNSLHERTHHPRLDVLHPPFHLLATRSHVFKRHCNRDSNACGNLLYPAWLCITWASSRPKAKSTRVTKVYDVFACGIMHGAEAARVQANVHIVKLQRTCHLLHNIRYNPSLTPPIELHRWLEMHAVHDTHPSATIHPDASVSWPIWLYPATHRSQKILVH